MKEEEEAEEDEAEDANGSYRCNALMISASLSLSSAAVACTQVNYIDVLESCIRVGRERMVRLRRGEELGCRGSEGAVKIVGEDEG